MARRGLKRILPKSLFGRAALILIAPMLLLQIVVALVFIQRHWDGVTRQMTRGVAAQLSGLARVIEDAESEPKAIARALWQFEEVAGYTVDYVPGVQIAPEIRRPFWEVTDWSLTDTLLETIDRPIRVDTVAERKSVEIEMQLAGGVLYAAPATRLMIASKPHILLVWMVLAAAALLTVAVLFLRNQVRPIRQLADAAEAFGKGRPAPPFAPAGAEEVRRAAGAFSTMRSRIERQIAQRTLMLSGVSHDLRTPLTRMRLTVAMLDDAEDREALSRDIGEMERMIDSFLAFARGEGGEAPGEIDMRVMIADLVKEARAGGADIALERADIAPERARITGRPLALRRCLRNLIENAAKYGSRVRVALEADRSRLRIHVEDDGPGVPEASRDAVFRPFLRLDAARNMDDGGGSGLGLAIARDAARIHGGDIVLGESALGGLRATVTLPL